MEKHYVLLPIVFKLSIMLVNALCTEAGLFHQDLRIARIAKITAAQFNLCNTQIIKICRKVGVYMPQKKK